MNIDSANIAKQIDDINRRFYDTKHKHFHTTRQFGWPGWKELPIALESSEKTVLDIGCGNGRFASFLDGSNHVGFRPYLYRGFDRQTHLLKKAALLQLGFETKWDLLDWSGELYCESPMTPTGTADLVVCFGVLHHIFHETFRLKFLNWCADHVRFGGRLIVSAWDFGRHEKYRDKRASQKTIEEVTGLHSDLLSQNDFFLGFGTTLDSLRYCHWLDDKESEELIDDFLRARPQFTLTERIERVDDLNRYWIFDRLASR